MTTTTAWRFLLLLLIGGSAAPALAHAKCRYEFDPPQLLLPVGATGGTIRIRTTNDCYWRATDDDTAMQLTPTGPMRGSGTLRVSVPAHFGDTLVRTITIGRLGPTPGPFVSPPPSTKYSVVQTACSYAVSPSTLSFGIAAGCQAVTVGTETQCRWNAGTDAPWLTVSPDSGKGGRTVSVCVAAGTDARTATATIAGQPVTVTQAPPDCGSRLQTSGGAINRTVQPTRPGPDYAPTIMRDGKYRRWWCGWANGRSSIFYAEADRFEGPWRGRSGAPADMVFDASGNPSDFDGGGVCDPSVVRVDGTYWMYYSGNASPTFDPSKPWRIGLARSTDGISWTRVTVGRALIDPQRLGAANPWGAGQPSALWRDGKMYLIYTDTTGTDSSSSGGGQYVLRSPTPFFNVALEELGPSGFAPYDAATHTARALLRTVSVDWMYVDVNDTFAIAASDRSDVTAVHFFDEHLRSELGTVELAGNWRDGPGLVHRPDGHAMPSARCGIVPLELLRTAGGADWSQWEFSQTTSDLDTGLDCACYDLPRVFEGTLLTGQHIGLALVTGGVRLQFARSEPSGWLARNWIEATPAIVAGIPYGATLRARQTTYDAPGRLPGFVLDDERLWATNCSEVIAANQSTVRTIPTPEWDAHARGPGLPCLR